MTRRRVKRPRGRPPHVHPCPFGCGKNFSTPGKAQMHANGAHRVGHPRTPIEHGTITGYKKELRRNLRTCIACRAAWAAYIYDLKAGIPPGQRRTHL